MEFARPQMSRWFGLLLACSLLLSTPPDLAAATNVTVKLHDGLATIVSKNATAAEILGEWALAGGTTIVNGDKLASVHLTIELIDVPEKQALDVVLRSASGYVATSRSAASAIGSRYDRIWIIASSSAPRESNAPPPPQRPIFEGLPPQLMVPPPTGVQRIIGPDGQPVADDQEGAPPPNRAAAPPGFFRGDDPSAPPNAASPAPPRTPAGVPVPGMIVPAPKPEPPTQR